MLINPCDDAVRVSLGLFRSVVLLCVGIDNRLGLGSLRLSISFFCELGLGPLHSGMAKLVEA